MTQTRRSIEVLIVDDSSLIRQRLIALLNGLDGVEVTGEAETAVHGLESVHALNPDVVTIDLTMPGGSGLKLLEEIRKLDKAPMTIVLTNYPYPEFRKRCAELGVDFFLNKASEIQRLPQILEENRARLENKR